MEHNHTRGFITHYKGHMIWTGIDKPIDKYLVQEEGEESAYNKVRLFDTLADAVQWVDVTTFENEKRSWRRYYIGLGAIFCAMQFLIIYLSKHV